MKYTLPGILVLFFVTVVLTSGCNQDAPQNKAIHEFAELSMTRTKHMNRRFFWRHDSDKEKAFGSQKELSSELGLKRSGEGERLFPLVSALIDKGWQLRGVSSTPLSSFRQDESTTITIPFRVTYHFTRLK